MAANKRFLVALAVFAAIGVLEWFTLEGRIRAVALALLGLFAFRTWIADRRQALDARSEGDRSRE